MKKRKPNIVGSLPARPDRAVQRPDFLARLKKIYKKTLKVAGADLVSSERNRF
jgi:hypothetical protein